MNGGGRRRLGQSVVSVCTAVKRRPVAGSGAKANEQTQNVRVTKNLNNGGGKDAWQRNTKENKKGIRLRPG